MNTKIIRTFLIVLQIILIGFLLLGDICAIATTGIVSNSSNIIASLIRCLASLAFTIFYYVSVSDSFSSDSLLFPLYLFFISLSETRMLERIQNVMNLHIIPTNILVLVFLFSSFMISLCLIGYSLFSNSSKSDMNLYTIAAITASLVITYYAPIAGSVSLSWNSSTLFIMISLLFAVGIIVSAIQAVEESSKSSRIKYFVCILLIVKDYTNLLFDSLLMNLIGTLLFIVSLVFVVTLVKINSTRL